MQRMYLSVKSKSFQILETVRKLIQQQIDSCGELFVLLSNVEWIKKKEDANVTISS